MIVRMLTVFWSGTGLIITFLFAWASNSPAAAADRSPWIWKLFPTLCNMETGACGTLLATKQARLFGPPNYVLGAAYFLFALGVALFTPMEPGALYWALVLVTTGVVFAGAFLMFSLIFTLQTNCVLCYATHAVTLMMLATLILNGILTE